MVGVTEYGEGMDVKLGYDQGRPVIVASSEAGYSSTFVDLIQVLEWVNKNMPEFKRREWVGVTKNYESCYLENEGNYESCSWEYVEAKLKEKNT